MIGRKRKEMSLSDVHNMSYSRVSIKFTEIDSSLPFVSLLVLFGLNNNNKKKRQRTCQKNIC